MDKVYLLTGGTSGIGYHAAVNLAKAEPTALVVFTGRTQSTDPYPSNVEFRSLDLASRDSIRDFAASWPHGPISILALNAGMGSMVPTFTPEGLETTFAVNHLGHALLFFLLNSRDLFTPTCHIFTVTSALHDPKSKGAPVAPVWTNTEDVAHAAKEKQKSGQVAYANSKLAVVLWTWALVTRAKAAGKTWRINTFEPGWNPGGNSKLGRSAPSALQFIARHIIGHMLWIFRLRGTVVSTPPESGKYMADFALGKVFAHVDGERDTSEDSHRVDWQEDIWNWTVKELALDNNETKV